MRKILYLSVLLTFVLGSCMFKVKKFTTEELKWYKPFSKTDTIIFISDRTEWDTIIFHKIVRDSDSKRDFEQGFYDMNYLTVPYNFTKGSYHQFALMSDGKTYYDQDILNMSKSSNTNNGEIEIIFIGTIFSGEELKNVKKINDNTYFFDSKRATYSGMNVDRGIKDFTFNTEIGVVNYTDDRGVKWKRNKPKL
jgi:hypothetical protein